MSSHGPFYKNALWQYGMQLVKYLLPLITLPYLTRVLKPEGYAVCAYIASFMTFVQIFVDFGFNLSGTKLIASARNVREENRAIGVVTQARVLLCIVAGVVVVVIALNISVTSENMAYTFLAYLAVCGRAIAPDFVFQGHEKMGPLTIRYFISKGLSTLLTFVCVHSVADIIWVPVLDILASVIALVWSFVASKRLFGVTVERVSAAVVIKELRSSALYCVSNIASTVSSSFATLLIGIVIADVAQVSYWSLAMTVLSAAVALYAPITNSLYPHMVVSGDFGFARRLILISLPFVLGGTVILCVFADGVVLLLGGQPYLEGAYAIRLLSPVAFFSFYGMLFGWPILGASGKVKELTRTTALSGAFLLIALIVVTVLGHASIAAFAVVRSITEALMCGLRYFECRRVFSAASNGAGGTNGL